MTDQPKPSQEAMKLAKVYLKKVRGNFELTHCQKLDILAHLIDAWKKEQDDGKQSSDGTSDNFA